MKKDLLELDRLPTLDELKEFFKENDWTSTKIDDPAKRTDEECAEIAYAAKLMDLNIVQQQHDFQETVSRAVAVMRMFL